MVIEIDPNGTAVMLKIVATCDKTVFYHLISLELSL